jgi:hypothetical protein
VAPLFIKTIANNKFFIKHLVILRNHKRNFSKISKGKRQKVTKAQIEPPRSLNILVYD